MQHTLKRLLTKLGPFLGLILVIVLFSLPAQMRDVFPTYGNFRFILIQTVIVAVSALGMTLIIVSGGIDLSAGSSIAFTSVVGASLIQRGWSPAAVLVACVAAIAAWIVYGPNRRDRRARSTSSVPSAMNSRFHNDRS